MEPGKELASKFKSGINKVFHFSGGRSSAYMVIHNYKPGDLVIFCDTEREFEDTYRFVLDFEKETGINIVWLTFKGGWKRLIEYEKALPNISWRKCTINLKIRLARRYLRSIGLYTYTQCIGFRADEIERVNGYNSGWYSVKTIFPLHRDNVDASLVDRYWKSISWELVTAPILSNCDGCFLKGKANLMLLFSCYPEVASKWIQDEVTRGKGKTFIKGVSYFELFEKSASMKIYPGDLYRLRSAYNCTCTS